MAETPTALGLGRIDPDSDEFRDAYQIINENATKTTELIVEDRAQMAALAGQVGGQEALATTMPAAGVQSVSVGGVRVMPGVDARYAAFPGAAVLADGRKMVVWREATDHVNARDGVVKASTTSDNGLTWSDATTPLATAGVDYRDPCLFLSRDKARLYLTYFTGSAANAAEGYFVRVSTNQGVSYGDPVRIDAHPYAAGCSPLVEMEDGQLLATWYGKDAIGDARDSVYVASSPDQGATWGNRVKLLNGVTASLDYQEPYIGADGADVTIMYRAGNAANIGIIKSSNGGATWGTPATRFPGTGRPGFVITSRGTIIVIYRVQSATMSEQHGAMRYSRDGGVTWSQAYLVERAAPIWWTYSAPIEVAPGQILVPTTVEYTGALSKLSFRYITEGGGISPFGDIPATGPERAIRRANSIALADDFDRPNSPSLGVTLNGQEWVSTGNATILDGALHAVNGSTHGMHYANALTPDVDIEADLSWAGTAGVYIIFRLQNTSNYLYAGIETNGTALRIYKVVAGAAPAQIGTTATIAAPAGPYHRLRITAVGSTIRAYFEDALVITATDTTFQTMPWVGLRTGGTVGGTVHRASYFLARRRTGIAS